MSTTKIARFDMSKTVRSTPSPQAGGVVVRTPAEGVQATVGDRKLELTDQTFYLPRRKIITVC